MGTDATNGSADSFSACTTYAPSTINGPKPIATQISPRPRCTSRSGGAV